MKVNGECHPIAQLYGRPPIDCVIEVARAVAEDYFARPRRYRQLPSELSQLLSDFHDKVCGDPAWPDKEQRSRYYETLSGKTTADDHPQTCLAEVTFLAAAEAQRGLHDTAATFQAYLHCSDGEAMKLANDRTAGMFDRAAKLLASGEIARVFGSDPPAAGARSFLSAGDAEAACLVEAITQELEPATTGIIPRYTFLVAQRLAAARRDTVDAVLAGAFVQDPKAFDALARNAVSWARALRDFHTDTVIRAWRIVRPGKPVDYSQLSLRDNPAGWQLHMESILDALAVACGGT